MGTMDAIEIVYLISFFLGLGFAIITGLLSGVGSGDGHVDTGGHDAGGHGHGGDMHFSPFSPVVIAMFVSTFGGTGIILRKITPWSAVAHVPVALASGFVVAALVFYIFWKLFDVTQGSSEARVDELIGLQAEVTTTIPPNGVGEIAYVAKQQRFTGPARSTDNREIPARTAVKISRMLGTTFFVERSA